MAFRTRAHHEAVRFMLLQGDRAQLQQGISPWVTCREHRWDAEQGYSFKGFMWDLTVRGPVLDEDDEPLPIRLPGMILRGDEVTLTKVSTPHEYEHLWREYQLDEYFRARAKVRDERICQQLPRARHRVSDHDMWCDVRCCGRDWQAGGVSDASVAVHVSAMQRHERRRKAPSEARRDDRVPRLSRSAYGWIDLGAGEGARQRWRIERAKRGAMTGKWTTRGGGRAVATHRARRRWGHEELHSLWPRRGNSAVAVPGERRTRARLEGSVRVHGRLR
jgi:hypothetical protein